MKVKFNKFERIAGLFVVTAIVGTLLTALSVAIKQGWFEKKIAYEAIFENADGLHQGTVVQMAGLRAGAVDEVELQANNRILVRFHILGKFQERLRQDSKVQLIRPFIIGERVLDVTVGSDASPIMPERAQIASIETTDIMTLLSGRNTNNYLSKISGILENMQVLMEAFAQKSRAESLVRMFDQLDPLLRNLNTMSLEVIQLSQQATDQQGVKRLVSNLNTTTSEMNKILPGLNKENPQLAKDLAVMTQNLAIVTRSLGPAMAEIEPEMPKASRRLMQVLDETVVVLKAMQKSFFMRSNVQEVLDEEKRLPASK